MGLQWQGTFGDNKNWLFNQSPAQTLPRPPKGTRLQTAVGPIAAPTHCPSHAAAVASHPVPTPGPARVPPLLGSPSGCTAHERPVIGLLPSCQLGSLRPCFAASEHPG